MQKEPSEIFREIRRSLAEWLESSAEARIPVSRILKSLDALEDILDRHQGDQVGKQHTDGRTASRGQKSTTYTVETTSNGEVLTEGRPEGKSPPFRVAKALYMKLAEVFGSAAEPLRFEEIHKRLIEVSSVPPADFQVRVCLRFWLSLKKPLITRNRNAYQPVHVKSFSSEAQKAWAAARS